MVNHRIVELNNKSRKGRYLLVWEKGYPFRHYKIRGELGIEKYIEYYTEKYLKGNKSLKFTQKIIKTDTSKTTRQLEKLTRKISKQPTIKRAIHPGVTQANLGNLWNMTDTTIRKARKTLLGPLIVDETILNLMTTDENFKKLKHKLTTKITFIGENGEDLGFIEELQKDPSEVITSVKKAIKPYIQIGFASSELKKNGIKLKQVKENGNIKTADVSIIFRKG